MRLGDPNPETRYDFLKFVAKRRGISVAEAYRRGKRKGVTREGMEDSLRYHMRRPKEVGVLLPNPFFSFVQRET